MSDQETDPKFDALYQEAMAREDVYRFRNVLRDVANKIEASEKEAPVIHITRKPSWGWMAVAASVAILVVGAIFWLDRSPDHSELAMAYAQDDRSSLRSDQASGRNADEDLLDSARVYLSEGNVGPALSILQNGSVADPCVEARRKWLFALAYLIEGRTEKAKAELRVVAGSGCMVKDPAKELLDQL